MPKYTPSGGKGGSHNLPPPSHRAKPKKEGCLMAIPQVITVVARLALARVAHRR